MGGVWRSDWILQCSPQNNEVVMTSWTLPLWRVLFCLRSQEQESGTQNRLQEQLAKEMWGVGVGAASVRPHSPAFHVIMAAMLHYSGGTAGGARILSSSRWKCQSVVSLAMSLCASYPPRISAFNSGMMSSNKCYNCKYVNKKLKVWVFPYLLSFLHVRTVSKVAWWPEINGKSVNM